MTISGSPRFTAAQTELEEASAEVQHLLERQRNLQEELLALERQEIPRAQRKIDAAELELETLRREPADARELEMLIQRTRERLLGAPQRSPTAAAISSGLAELERSGLPVASKVENTRKLYWASAPARIYVEDRNTWDRGAAERYAWGGR